MIVVTLHKQRTPQKVVAEKAGRSSAVPKHIKWKADREGKLY